MQVLFRVLMLVLLITGLAFSAASVNAQQSGVQQLILQMLSGVNPQWAQIPGAPGVQYAPNANADLFRYDQRYYYQHDGNWYRGRDMAGPWERVQDVPQSFHRIEAPYFKRPPGWAQGNKTGWKGDNMPPGQRKKYDGDQHVYHGQVNNHEGGQHAYQRQNNNHEGGQHGSPGQKNKHNGGKHGQKDKHDGGQHGQKNKH